MKVQIGCGAGFAGDRFEAAGPILDHLEARDGPRYIMFECLGERTLALAQDELRRDPTRGYSPFLDRYLRPILSRAMKAGIRIVTNMGAANPVAGARRVQALAREIGTPVPRVAVVLGDDLRALLDDHEIRALPRLDGAALIDKPIVAANVYLGAVPVRDAIATGAEIILVGRTTDSALALGPLMHEFGWLETDLDHLAAGTITGHLLECGGQVTGAYFADPGFKDVPDLAHVGFPIAEVDLDGSFIITKPPGTGGCVTRATVTEQLLYEIHDPAAYLVPDVSCDVTGLTLKEEGPDRIRVDTIVGHPRPDTLKATISVDNGWMAEAEMSYAGPNALARAELAADVVGTRLREAGVDEVLGIDVLGAGATFGRGRKRTWSAAPDGDYRLRLSLISDERAHAALVIEELQALYCSGPAAGGGFRSSLTPQIATASVLVPRQIAEMAAIVEVIEP